MIVPDEIRKCVAFAAALQRRDFDVDAETLRIERIATHGEITTPKADSGREVPVPA
jgi:hypothetical protein